MSAGFDSATPGGSSMSAASEPLPHEMEECYAVIRFQRVQIAQLRTKLASVEDQNAQVRCDYETLAQQPRVAMSRAKNCADLQPSVAAI